MGSRSSGTHRRSGEAVGGVQQVRAFLRPEHPHAVELPGGVGGEGEEDLPVPLQDRRALVDPEVPPLPAVVRGGEDCGRRRSAPSGSSTRAAPSPSTSGHRSSTRSTGRGTSTTPPGTSTTCGRSAPTSSAAPGTPCRTPGRSWAPCGPIDCLADRYVAHSDIPPAAARGRGCDECIIACLCPGCKSNFSF